MLYHASNLINLKRSYARGAKMPKYNNATNNVYLLIKQTGKTGRKFSELEVQFVQKIKSGGIFIAAVTF